MEDKTTPKFHLTLCNINIRFTKNDPLSDLKQEELDVTLHFSGSGDTRKIGNDKLIASIMEKLGIIP